MQQLCFATHNLHKRREIEALFSTAGIALALTDLYTLGHMGELEESHNTFRENAFQKATFVYATYQVPCFADDSGLVVKALDGEPGVYSARYAGVPKSDVANRKLLLKRMEGVSQREAYFKTVIAFVGPGIRQHFEGKVKGYVTTAPRGTGGFGYDSLFVPQGFDQTYAELSLVEKNTVSSRIKAFQAFYALLKTRFK